MEVARALSGRSLMNSAPNRSPHRALDDHRSLQPPSNSSRNLEQSSTITKMCQELVVTIEHRCGHRIDKPADIRELNGCKDCGVIKQTNHLGKTVKRDPCPDCVANGVWVKNNGKWKEA
ncbi:hypothetical protein BJX64DRAFT_293793 [Aspergillus heterothallicus]